MRDPRFREVLNHRRAAAADGAVEALHRLGQTAVETLQSVMERAENDAARVSAARVVLDRIAPPGVTVDVTNVPTETDPATLPEIVSDVSGAVRAVLFASRGIPFDSLMSDDELRAAMTEFANACAQALDVTRQLVGDDVNGPEMSSSIAIIDEGVPM